MQYEKELLDLIKMAMECESMTNEEVISVISRAGGYKEKHYILASYIVQSYKAGKNRGYIECEDDMRDEVLLGAMGR